MPKIYDAFLFYNELDLLEIRLHELYPVVDKFILVEGEETFSGSAKPSYYLDNKERFSRFADKIEHVTVPALKTAKDAWEREFDQRAHLISGADDLDDRDILIISDVDEIPSREAVELMATLPQESFLFLQIFCYFRFDFVRDAPIMTFSVGERMGAVRASSITDLRNARIKRALDQRRRPDPSIVLLENAGWHLSFFGDQDFVVNKIRSFSHQEYNTAEFLDTLDIEACILEEKDIFGRSRAQWKRVDHLDHLPHLVLEDPQRFQKYMIRSIPKD